MQHVSSLGGPRVLLPIQYVERWINELGDEPTPDEGLYSLACSIHNYCGIVRLWDTQILVFGDDPANIYWSPTQGGGLFIRWVGANSLDQLTAFAKSVVDAGNWSERIEWDAQFTNYILMDACTFVGDDAPRIAITIPAGKYVIESQYAKSEDVIAIVQHLRSTRE